MTEFTATVDLEARPSPNLWALAGRSNYSSVVIPRFSVESGAVIVRNGSME
jgi:hypothetical protein